MSRREQILMLVVLMFAYAVSDLQINFNISDSNSTSLLKDLQMDLSEKQRESQSKQPDAQLSSCNDITPSDKHVNSFGCDDFFIDELFDEDYALWESSKGLELFQTGPVTTVVIPSIYTIVFIISVPLNICALVVFIRKLKPLKAASIYMMNLACADLLFAATLLFQISYYFNGSDWIFGSAMCRLVSAAFFWNMFCTILLIACISVDRLLAVVYPVKSLTWRSPRKAVIICVAMWVLSIAGSLPLLLTELTLYIGEPNITTCFDIMPSELFEFYMVYFFTLCCLFIFLPLVITAVSYIWIIVTLSKAQPGVPGHDRKKRRAVVLASTVLVMFVICFAPMNCLCIARVLDSDPADRLYVFLRVSLSLTSLNCILDPLVYYFGSSKFQKELSSMLGCQKTTQGTLGGQASSDPKASTSQTALKSNRKETDIPLTNIDSCQSNLV